MFVLTHEPPVKAVEYLEPRDFTHANRQHCPLRRVIELIRERDAKERAEAGRREMRVARAG